MHRHQGCCDHRADSEERAMRHTREEPGEHQLRIAGRHRGGDVTGCESDHEPDQNRLAWQAGCQRRNQRGTHDDAKCVGRDDVPSRGNRDADPAGDLREQPMVTNSVVPMANPPIASARIARLTCRHDTGASTSTRSVSATMEAAVTAESLPNAPSRAGIAEILQTGCRPTPCETAPTFQRTAGVNDHTTSERIHFESLCPADLASRRHRHSHARAFLDSLATRRGWLCPTQREGPSSAGPFLWSPPEALRWPGSTAADPAQG